MASHYGVLLVNLGTPDDCTPAAVKKYLAEFLADHRVVEQNKWLWLPILHGIILQLRPRKSARAYQKIWTETGSPLLNFSILQQQALQERLGESITVKLAMRYGNPSLAKAFVEFQQAGIDRIFVLPLYPQYSATTSASVIDGVTRHLEQQRIVPSLRWICDYHDHPAYIDALAHSVRQHWKNHGQSEKLILSFHGIPQLYADKGDPYPVHCGKTAELLAIQLGLQPNEWVQTFQSRVGPKAWLEPYTDKTLESLAKQGVKSVDLICPGFSVDCLETLEENAMENRDLYLANGGEKFHYIPALNAETKHIELMEQLVRTNLAGWLE